MAAKTELAFLLQLLQRTDPIQNTAAENCHALFPCLRKFANIQGTTRRTIPLKIPLRSGLTNQEGNRKLAHGVAF